MKKLLKDPEFQAKTALFAISGMIIVLFYVILTHFTQIFIGLKKFIDILSPFILGVALAYIMSLIANPVEKLFPKAMTDKNKRVYSSLIAILLFAVIVALFVVVLIPPITASVTQLIDLINRIASDMSGTFEHLTENLNLNPKIEQTLYELFRNSINTIITFTREQIPNIIASTITGVRSVVNFVIGIVVAIYVLIDREILIDQIKRLSKAILPEKHFNSLNKVIHLTDTKLGSFISGKVISSAIIGLICFFLMNFLQMNYSVLIAFVIGITNIIPIFGPWIGSIPCLFILLISDPIQSLYLLGIILVVQFLDSNVIGPRVVGESVGLSSLWIMFATILGGSFFGFTGLILGVPFFAVFYFLMKEFVSNRLKQKESGTNNA
ncbi:MAG: AI-2E family transporter [Erysipelotrichaceae bacterium]|nr:AI-2E family transporter [Erysipelotrichaceae bacterium]